MIAVAKWCEIPRVQVTEQVSGDEASLHVEVQLEAVLRAISIEPSSAGKGLLPRHVLQFLIFLTMGFHRHICTPTWQ